jgi:hypothetical protein
LFIPLMDELILSSMSEKSAIIYPMVCAACAVLASSF